MTTCCAAPEPHPTRRARRRMTLADAWEKRFLITGGHHRSSEPLEMWGDTTATHTSGAEPDYSWRRSRCTVRYMGLSW
jgi:hypothetical protein